ncbi:MAG: hypothetical protein ACRD3W_27670 [Terriglobales bacterium]
MRIAFVDEWAEDGSLLVILLEDEGRAADNSVDVPEDAPRQELPDSHAD